MILFSDRQVWANSADQVQTAPRLIRVYTVSNTGCIFWVHYYSVKPSCSNFRVITAIFWDVRIFRIFTVMYVLICFLLRLVSLTGVALPAHPPYLFILFIYLFFFFLFVWTSTFLCLSFSNLKPFIRESYPLKPPKELKDVQFIMLPFPAHKKKNKKKMNIQTSSGFQIGCEFEWNILMTVCLFIFLFSFISLSIIKVQFRVSA